LEYGLYVRAGRKSFDSDWEEASWELKESRVEEDGSVRQTYIRKGDDWRWKL